jgi:hypothetical protein
METAPNQKIQEGFKTNKGNSAVQGMVSWFQGQGGDLLPVPVLEERNVEVMKTSRLGTIH